MGYKGPHKFPYQPLLAGHIRLLKFLPGNIPAVGAEDVLENQPEGTQIILTPCELVYTSLEDAPPYVALSYAWGDPSHTHHIVINECAFPVAKNLFSFFAQVGEHYLQNDLPLWIDAICIDQEDFPERSIQVLQMSLIYESAYQIHAWLGPQGQDSTIAVQKIASMYGELANSVQENGRDELKAFAEITPQNAKFFDPSDAADRNAWQAIFHLLDKSWWTRAWVVQEATSKPTVWILCGEAGTTFDAIDATMGILRELIRYPETAEVIGKGTYDNILTLYELKSRRRARELALLEALQRFYKYGCSEPRDKVYSALGVACDVGDSIVPDYKKPIGDVYADVAHFSLSNEDPYARLDFLGHVLLQDTEMEDRLPTWVPDWRRERHLHPFGKRFHFGEEIDEVVRHEVQSAQDRVYSATRDSVPEASIQGTKLFIKGFYFDKIETLTFIDKANPDREFVREWIPRDFPPEIDDTYYLTGQTFEQACLHTLTADVETLNSEPIRRGHAVGSWIFEDKWDDVTDVVESRNRHREFGTMKYATHHRRMIFSRKGYIGLGPSAARKGDMLCAFLGGQVLYILREVVGSEGHFEFIGECYVHGLMDGDLMEGCGNGWEPYPQISFTLV